MKKSFKRAMTVVLCSILCVMLGACGKSSKAKESKSDGPVTIQFWHSLSGANSEAIKKVVDDYNASQDKVKVKATFQGNYDSMSVKLQQAIAAGDGPDVSMIGYGYVGDFYKAKVLEDLTPYFEKSGIKKDDFIKGLMLESFYGDKCVTIPFNRSTPVLHINKTALDEAGQPIPKTWDEFSTVANALVQKNGKKITRYGSVMQKDSWFPFSMISQYNGKFYNDEGKGFDFIDNGIGHNIFTQLKTMQNSGAMYYASNANSYEDTLQAFLTKKAPIAFSSSAASLAIETGKPDFEYTTAFLPAGDRNAAATGGGNLAMLSSSKHKKAAWDFIEWLLKDEKGAAAFTIETGYLPFTNSMSESEPYKKLYEEKPYRKVAFDQLQYAEDTTINNKHAAVLTEFYAAIEAIMYDNKDIDKTLQNFEKEGTEILNKD